VSGSHIILCGRLTTVVFGYAAEEFSFMPKHKSNAYGTTDESNG